MPVSWPTTENDWWPSASISAARSLAKVRVSYPCPLGPGGGLLVSPRPRWSTAMTEKSRASVGITRRQAYQNWGQPCTSSNGGPLPPVTTCWRSPPALMNRLVNPLGGFGGCELDPGPLRVAALAACAAAPV